jgi:ADP-ribose pyrophosphatase YjhB (NUDIX family)
MSGERPSRLATAFAAGAAALFKRLGGYLQWRVLWWRHDAFIVGVAGVALDQEERVLLLEHRFWTGNPWGLPSGYAQRGETWEDTFAREVREETGIEVRDVRLLCVRSGFRLRVEVYMAARVADPAVQPRVDGREVLSARMVPVEELPAGLRPAHYEMIRLAQRGVSGTRTPRSAPGRSPAGAPRRCPRR